MIVVVVVSGGVKCIGMSWNGSGSYLFEAAARLSMRPLLQRPQLAARLSVSVTVSIPIPIPVPVPLPVACRGAWGRASRGGQLVDLVILTGLQQALAVHVALGLDDQLRGVLQLGKDQTPEGYTTLATRKHTLSTTCSMQHTHTFRPGLRRTS